MVAFLESLEPQDREELAALFQTVGFETGEHLFEQGDVSEGAFILESGEIELTMTLPGGEHVPIARMGAGAFVGELAWLQDATRTLSATAVTPVRAHYVDAADFRALLSSYRPSAFHLLLEVMRLVGQRVRKTEQAAMALCGQGSSGRATEATANVAAALEDTRFDPRPYLDAFPLFAALTRRDIEELLTRGVLVEASRGAILTGTERSPQSCWIVMYGALEAICPTSRLRMAVLGPGVPVGHLERLLEEEFLVELRVREPAVLLELPASVCTDLMSPTSRLSYRLLHGLCIASIEALERANLILAREQRMHETDHPGSSAQAHC